MLEFVISCDMEPYDRAGPVTRYLDLPQDETLASPTLDSLRRLGKELWAKTGLSGPMAARAKPGFESSPFRGWLAAADAQRSLAARVLAEVPGLGRGARP